MKKAVSIKKTLPISEMYVVSMPNPHDGPRVPVKPWEGMDSLFLAEDCARFTFVMNAAEFAKLPPEIASMAEHHKQTPPPKGKDPVRVERGMLAYDRLLRLAVGLEDANSTTPAKSKYVFPQWNAFKEHFPERADEFGRIIHNISRDCTIINSHTAISMIPKPSIDLATKRLMGLKREHSNRTAVHTKQDILVVVDKEPITQGLIKQLAQSEAVGTIYLTHPDALEADLRLHEIKQLIAGKQFNLRTTRLDKIPFEQALNMDRFDHVAICTPIGKYPEHDQALISAWKARTKEDGFIVHRKGNPLERQTTTPPYSTANLRNFIGVEQLDAELPKILADNDRELKRAGDLARNRAANRVVNTLVDQDIHGKSR